jgi:hypothetical protein
MDHHSIVHHLTVGPDRQLDDRGLMLRYKSVIAVGVLVKRDRP